MNAKTSAAILVMMSIVYGGAIAILGALNSPAVTIVAVVGALLLGALWVARGLFLNRDRQV